MTRLNRRRFLSAAAASGGLCALGSATLGPRSGWAQAKARDEASGKPVERYVSDYISFVGSDDIGRVYLAHDNNRGQTGERFFADHWIAMYDSATGWVDVNGSRHYENTSKVLDRIPPSQHFRFEGSRETGLSFTSQTNAMALTLEAIDPVIRRGNADGTFQVGAASATMKWNERTIKGRVIFEYLMRRNWNRFTNSFEANWKNFNGLYLKTRDGKDFYLHSHERTGGSDLTGRLIGMATWGQPDKINGIEFTVTESVVADGGQFRWPTRWRADFWHNEMLHKAEFETEISRDVAWWKTGGFMMSVINGTISDEAGGKREATGWAELLI